MAVAGRRLPAAILRPPNILGGHPRSIWCHNLAQNIKAGKQRISGDGSNTWAYVHVDNLVDAIVPALTHPAAAGRAYTILDGHTTVKE